jgi:hypothetical protein
VLLASEDSDSRPILFRRDYGGLKGFHVAMGGKIDNGLLGGGSGACGPWRGWP